jgi:carbamoyl-phosphate synthase large subunit
MNMRNAFYENAVYVLEANPRASRTVPIVSKVCGLPMARLATRIILGQSILDLGLEEHQSLHYGVKEAVFSLCGYDQEILMRNSLSLTSTG